MAQHWFDCFCANPSIESFAHSRSCFLFCRWEAWRAFGWSTQVPLDTWTKINGGSPASPRWCVQGVHHFCGQWMRSSAFSGHDEGKWKCDYEVCCFCQVSWFQFAFGFPASWLGFWGPFQDECFSCARFSRWSCLYDSPRGSNFFRAVFSQSVGPSWCLVAGVSVELWKLHRRLGHLSFDLLSRLSGLDLVQGLPKLKYQKDLGCAPCWHGKMIATSHQPLTAVMIERPCEMFHMDMLVQLVCARWVGSGMSLW
jgi:hypothetical protein